MSIDARKRAGNDSTEVVKKYSVETVDPEHEAGVPHSVLTTYGTENRTTCVRVTSC